MIVRAILVLAIGTATMVAQGRGRPPGDRREMTPNREGKWWTNPMVIRRLTLSAEQQRKLEDIFQQSRLKLIDLTAALQKEEAILDPLLADEHPQEAKVFAQIDRVADARAALEKTNSRMLFAFRSTLSSEQWIALQSPGPGPGPGPRPGPR